MKAELRDQISFPRRYVCQNCSQPIPADFDSIYCEFCDLNFILKEIRLYQSFVQQSGGLALGD